MIKPLRKRPVNLPSTLSKAAQKRRTRIVQEHRDKAIPVPLTAAAHSAGFSDSAHLSRTFRDYFGVAPSFLFEHRSHISYVAFE